MKAVVDLAIDQVFDLTTLTHRAALRWGRRTALVFDEFDVRLSFEDVDVRSNQFANALRAEGVAPGDRVALMLRNRPEFLPSDIELEGSATLLVTAGADRTAGVARR